MVSGSDDQSVIVWDKQTSQLLEELKGHDAQVCLLRPSIQVFYIRSRTRKVFSELHALLIQYFYVRKLHQSSIEFL